ncbi:DciA family protein [Candidimonas humi]|uniref:DciA family protein n=1 Tax=Candidimonas humi TaxID=683355 RepID=A0ABV8P005_9BURK|nr:DciA family protein [Candidimonas humi]
MLLAIEQAAGEILPPALRQVCRVARMDRQQLTLAVPGAAHAAKLRQLAPRIAQRLSEGGWNLNQVQVKVQAGLSYIGTNPPRAKNVEPLGEKALDAFETLHASLRPGPLADAVGRLLAHHKP